MLFYKRRFNCVVVLATLCNAYGFIFVIGTRRPGSSIQLAQVSDDFGPSRRRLMFALAGIWVAPSLVSAAVTDETDSFANTGYDSSYRDLKTKENVARVSEKKTTVSPSDELTITIPKSALSKGLGLELGQVEFRTNIRVFVKSTVDGSPAEKLGIREGYVFVSVNGDSTERTNAEGVAIMVSRAVKNSPEDGFIELCFRDPGAFREQLADVGNREVTTQVAPAGGHNPAKRRWVRQARTTSDGTRGSTTNSDSAYTAQNV